MSAEIRTMTVTQGERHWVFKSDEWTWEIDGSSLSVGYIYKQGELRRRKTFNFFGTFYMETSSLRQEQKPK